MFSKTHASPTLQISLKFKTTFTTNTTLNIYYIYYIKTTKTLKFKTASHSNRNGEKLCVMKISVAMIFEYVIIDVYFPSTTLELAVLFVYQKHLQ